MIKPKSNGSSSLRNAAILSAVVAVLYFAHELLIPRAFAKAAASVREFSKEISTASAPAATPSPGARPGRRNAPGAAPRPQPVKVVQEPATELQYVGGLIKPFLRPLGEFGIVVIFTLY